MSNFYVVAQFYIGSVLFADMVKKGALILAFLLLSPVVSALTVEEQFLQLLNDERVKVGVSELALDSSLTAAAYGHSEDMAVNNYFSHNSKDGRRFSDRIIAQGYRYSIAGENIAYHYGAPDAAKVFEMWMNSPGHKSNMLSSSFSDAGLGVYYTGKYTYYTLDLGRKIGTSPSPPISNPPVVNPPTNPPIVNPPKMPSVPVNQTDTRKPVIYSLSPSRGFFEESIRFVFREENPGKIELVYGGNGESGKMEISKEECMKNRDRFECEVEPDFSRFDNSKVEFFVNVEDESGNFASSRKNTLSVDFSDPIIEFSRLDISGRAVSFFLEIAEPNLKSVSYVDLSDRIPNPRRLCSRLNEGVCEGRRTFREGEHLITIIVEDKNGNFVYRNETVSI